MCLTVRRGSRDLRRLSRNRSATFFKKFLTCLKRRKKAVWQSADGRVTSDDCRVTFQWLFSEFCRIAWNVETSCLTVGRRSSDLRRLSRDRSAIFSNFFLICLKRRKTLFDSQLTVAWPPTTVTWPFSDYFEKFSDLLETWKKVVLQSADGRVTSDDCRVTVQRLFSKFCHFCWNVEIQLFDSRPRVAWPPTIVAWPFSDFFVKFSLFAWNVE